MIGSIRPIFSFEKALAISPLTVVVAVIVVTALGAAGGITIGAAPIPTTIPSMSTTISAIAVVVCFNFYHYISLLDENRISFIKSLSTGLNLTHWTARRGVLHSRSDGFLQALQTVDGVVLRGCK